MRNFAKAWIAGAALLIATPALAQDGEGEIMVTGSRISAPAAPIVISNPIPAAALTLRRTADFAVQSVKIAGDTDEEEPRRNEILAMVKGAIEKSGNYGVQLATGELVVEPLTLANYKNLAITEDEEEYDTEFVRFLIKTPLAPGMDAKTALDRITRFMKELPAVGRAQIKPEGELTLSVVRPEQYRIEIVKLVAADAAKIANEFGPAYGAQISGLDRPVQWGRASLTEVFLYLPANYTVVPKH